MFCNLKRVVFIFSGGGAERESPTAAAALLPKAKPLRGGGVSKMQLRLESILTLIVESELRLYR